MGKSSAPAAPNPYETAQAQTGLNKESAAYNAALNRTNTYSPLGSSTFKQTGTDRNTGAPIYDNTIALTPTGQQTLDASQQQELGMAKAGNSLLDNLGNSISQPVDYSSVGKLQSQVNGGDLDATRQQSQDAIYRRQASMLDPQYKQGEEALDSQLANQGIGIGSQAYTRAKADFSRERDFAYGQARDSAITGGNDYANQQFTQGLNSANLNNATAGQGLSQLFAQRNQPLNELSAFRSGSQVQQPQFQGQSPISSAPADFASAQNASYQGGLNSYNAKVGQQNSAIGAGASLAGAYMMAAAF